MLASNPTPLVPQPHSIEQKHTEFCMDLSGVFSERIGYINEMNLFLAHFHYLPHIISEKKIDCKRAYTWFTSVYSDAIWQHYYLKRHFGRSTKAEMFQTLYLLNEDLVVFFDLGRDTVRFLFHKTDPVFVQSLVDKIRRFKPRKRSKVPFMDLLVKSMHGICRQPIAITKPKLNIEENYNDDFKPVHDIILKRLLKKNDKGIVLLHGKPGTGKTSYIRHLIARMKKDVLFLPPNLASAITDPELLTLLVENPNSVLVIEDAENLIVDRERDGGSPVSALLNVSDGLLSDCLNIQIICSFNTDLSKIDHALLRKGRLIAKYEFKELETKKAQSLSNKLGFITTISSPMTLTDIYNQNEPRFSPIKNTRPIGFISRSIETPIDEAC